MKKNIIERTPSEFQCALLTCPSIFEVDNETFLVVGKKIDINDIPKEVKRKIGGDETVIEIPKNLILGLNKE